jgi:uncharacterized protein YjdB
MLVGPPKKGSGSMRYFLRARMAGGRVRVGALPVLTTILVLALGACEAGSLGPIPEDIAPGIRLNTLSLSLDRGDTSRIAASLVTSGGAQFSLEGGSSGSSSLNFQSSDPSIATVSRSGLVLAHRDGKVTIDVSSGDFLATSSVNVRPRGKQVIVSPQVDTIFAVGNSLQLSAVILNGAGKEISRTAQWSSLDPSIATVDPTGLVSAVTGGTAMVVAAVDGMADSARVVVSPSVPQGPVVAAVVVAPGDVQADLKEIFKLSATVKDGAGNTMPNVAVVWSSSDPTLASVTANGEVTAKANGPVMIRATAEAKSGTAFLMVGEPEPLPPTAAMVQVAPGEANTNVGSSTQFTATVKDEQGQIIADAAVTWSTSNPAVATVDPTGLVTALSKGAVNVFASFQDKSGSAFLNVLEESAPPPAVNSVVVSPAEAEINVGSTRQYTALVTDAEGLGVPGAEITWKTGNPAVATVSATGLVTAVAEGSAQITATVSGKTGSAQVVVKKAASTPVLTSIALDPAELSLDVGTTRQVVATPKDASGNPLTGVALTWSSTDPSIASVDANGLVTAKLAGSVTIRATAGDKTGSASVTVMATAVTPPPSEWDRVLSDVTLQGDIVVPADEKWLIGANVRISGNLRTDAGTIAMRPGSSLHFVGAKPEQYVGGGMRYDASFSKDWGIWVGGTGVLDIQGTPKVGWNRTGSDPSWKSGDELWISPTAAGDVAPRRWYPGQPIPRIDPRVPAAEIMNVTRDIVIEGPGHIHISSSRQQRIEYVTLRAMGILKPNVGTVDGPVTGRYAIHFHMQGEASRGTVVRGVAAINSGGRVYVPHTSHGITFEDVVSVNSMAEAFWWDDGHLTDDVLVDRLAVSGVYTPSSVTGQTNRYNAVQLQPGNRKKITNSAASGAAGGPLAVGFAWSGGARQPAHWTFEGNVSHNNGTGIRFWNNSGQPHHIRDVISYSNRIGTENGAYNNSNRYTNLLLIGNHLIQNASSNESDVDGGPARYTNLRVEALEGPALEVGGRNLASETYAEFVDSYFQAGPGSPKVLVKMGSNPWFAKFIRTDVLPTDITWDLTDDRNEGSHIIIEHKDGRIWDITVEDGKVMTTLR